MHMRTTLFSLTSALVASAFVVTAVARDYDQSNLPYNDVPNDRSTAIAISVLTEAGVVQGDTDADGEPTGKFRPNASLNRAEFMKIVMMLSDAEGVDGSFAQNCFIDVAANTWYAPYVCKAKAQGVVNGHQIPGKPAAQWPFRPNAAVQYEEAVKVLAELYALTLDSQGGLWYEKYLRAALANDLAISGLRPGDHIKRGEMARLVVAFLAFNEGELAKLRNAEAGMVASSSVSSGTGSSVSSASSVSSRTSSSSSRTSSASSVTSGATDPNADTSIRSQFIQLGSSNVIVGAVNLFVNSEALNVTRLTVTLAQSTPTVDSLLLYDENKRYLGRATLDVTVAGQRQYSLTLKSGVLQIPRRENFTIYARVAVKEFNQGGESNELVQLTSFGIEGTGDWSGDPYSQTYNDTFPVFITTRARITKIENAGDTTGFFTTGTNRPLAVFRFTGEGDAQGLSNLRVNTLAFQVSAPSGVTVSDVYIKRRGGDDQSSCSVSANIISCTSLPTTIGSVSGTPVLELYGTVAGSVSNPYLQISFNGFGNYQSAGGVTWTDGEATFTWLPLDSSSLYGTRWE
jgi:hypothetical protein